MLVVPQDTLTESQKRASHGCYVLSFAFKPANIPLDEISSLSRETVENDLQLVGLLLARNEVRQLDCFQLFTRS